MGLPTGFRNNGVFILPLGLKAAGFSENDVLEQLRFGDFLSENAGNHRFSEREFRKTVKSAFKDKYRYPMGHQNEKRITFLLEITNLERLKNSGSVATKDGAIRNGCEIIPRGKSITKSMETIVI